MSSSKESLTINREHRTTKFIAGGALAVLALAGCETASDGVRHYSSAGSESSNSADVSELFGEECATHPNIVAQSSTSAYAPIIEMSASETLDFMKNDMPNSLSGYQLTEKHAEQIEKGVMSLQGSVKDGFGLDNIQYRINIATPSGNPVEGDDFDICLDAGINKKSGGVEVNLNERLTNYDGE